MYVHACVCMRVYACARACVHLYSIAAGNRAKWLPSAPASCWRYSFQPSASILMILQTTSFQVTRAMHAAPAPAELCAAAASVELRAAHGRAHAAHVACILQATPFQVARAMHAVHAPAELRAAPASAVIRAAIVDAATATVAL